MSSDVATAERLEETIGLLTSLDRRDRIDALISIADRFQGVPESLATRPYPDDHKVPACESEAYLWAQRRDDGTLGFHFAVENPQGISAKAMAVLLEEGLSGAPLTQVAAIDPEIIYQVFGRELSMGKSMGLMGMVTMIRRSAEIQLAENRAAEGDG